MLIEAVQDGSQAMRDPVGGSVEFHFVPILKLISTLLIMGVFDDDDVTHILKMIEPNVFNPKKQEESVEETAEKEPQRVAEVKEEKQEAYIEEEYEDYGLGEEEEEEEEEEMDEEEEKAAFDASHQEAAEEADQLNGEKGAEETEKEVKPVETSGEAKDEHLEQGLFQMKLPESVKLQVQPIHGLTNF